MTANGNEVDTSFSEGNMLSIDFGLKNTLPVTVSVVPSALQAIVLFNARVRNLTGEGFERITLSLLGGATFQAQSFSTPGLGQHTTFGPLESGSAAGTFGSIASVSGGGALATISFTGPEYVEAYLGDWFLDGSGSDFRIYLGAVTDPIQLTITATVPEPEAWAMMLGGLFAVGALARRRLGRQVC